MAKSIIDKLKADNRRLRRKLKQAAKFLRKIAEEGVSKNRLYAAADYLEGK